MARAKEKEEHLPSSEEGHALLEKKIFYVE